MGGKGGKPKVQVTQYSMSIHFGIAARVDAVTGLTYGEKPIWSGRVEANQAVWINQPNLFGGDKKEGGVSGSCYMLLGGTDQILPNELSTRLGGDVGVNTPAFRGITSLFFTGRGTPSFGGGGGGLHPDRWDLPILQNPMWSWVIPRNGASAGFVWTSNTPYLRDLWATVERFPQQLDPATAKIPRSSISFAYDGVWKYRVVPAADAGAPGVPEAYISPGYDDSSWSEGPGGFGSGGPGAGLGVGTYVPTGEIGKGIWIRKKLSFPNPGAVGDLHITVYHDDGAWLWWNGAAIPVEATSDYFRGVATIPGSLIGSDNTIVCQILDSIPTGTPTAIYAGLDIRAGVGDQFDANPAHIIYECLTNAEWGMGEDPGNIDIDAFQRAALTLYNEGFGLSLMWSAESTIEDFVNEVLGHINGVLFTNPRTGKFTLRLTRDDYDESTLPVITPDHAVMDSFSRKAWGETVNEVKVTWTNPVNEQTETITLQDDGNIAMQGAVVSNSTNYYGIRRADLAMQVCARDLRAASAPLCTAEMSVDRTLWDLAPMDAVKVSWPEYGLNELIMRVTSIDYGSIGEGAITLSLLEDVFNLQAGAYSEPARSGWSNPVFPPGATDKALVLPAPYFGLAAALGAADPSDVQDPDTYEMVIAAPPTPGAVSYDLATRAIAANGDSTWETIDFSRKYLGYGELVARLRAEPKSFFPALINAAVLNAPKINDVVFIGAAGTPVEQMEIALVGSYDTDRNRYVLWRGALDTVPKDWPPGTPIWFGDADATLADATKRLAGSTATYRLLTNTSIGQLPLDSAPDVSTTSKARPSKPLRPADVRAAGVRSRVVFDLSVAATISLSWSTRNRLTEDSQALVWTDASVPPEDGATTTITVTDTSTGAVLGSVPGVSGGTYGLDLTPYFPGTPLLPATVRLNLSASRGGEASWSEAAVDVSRGINFVCANPGAEAGSTTGWSVVGPGTVSVSTTQFHSGTRSFVGSPAAGTNAVWMIQDVTIPSGYYGDIDLAYLEASCTAWVFNYLRGKNFTDLGVAILDAAGAWRGGRMVSLDDYAGRWQAGMPALHIPYEGRTLRIAARQRLRSTDDPCFIDDFQPSLRAKNSVCYDLHSHSDPANAGWLSNGATLGSSVLTGDSGWGLPALTAVITAADNAAVISRNVAIPSGALPGVDAGKAEVHYSAAISSLPNVGARLRVAYLDAAGAVLGMSYSSGDAGLTTLNEQDYALIDDTVPNNTRVIQLGIEAQSVSANTDVAVRVNWITAQLLDASGNQYADRNRRQTESGEDRATEGGELRIVDTSSVRGTNPDPYWPSVVALLPLDGVNGSTVFTDKTGKRTWSPVGDAKLSTAQSKFGAASLFVDGTGDAITTPSSTDFAFGTGDFTVEMFVMQNSPNLQWRELFMVNASGGINIMLYDGKLSLDREGLANDFRAAAAIPAGFHHIEVSRSSGVVSGFVDGVKVWSGSWTYNLTQTGLVSIGGKSTGASSLVGYVSQVRITKGVARHTDNFMPPTAAFPAF